MSSSSINLNPPGPFEPTPTPSRQSDYLAWVQTARGQRPQQQQTWAQVASFKRNPAPQRPPQQTRPQPTPSQQTPPLQPPPQRPPVSQQPQTPPAPSRERAQPAIYMLKLKTIDLAMDTDCTTTTTALHFTASDAAAAINAKLDELRASYGAGEWVGEGSEFGYSIPGKVLLLVRFRAMRVVRS
ncbi:hypothetical protein MMC30_008093 [Trapelia coarctata]|nr:hypothetical protein [Trapelia coarctata]